MNYRKHLALCGLKWDPFAQELPIEALWTSRQIDHFVQRMARQVHHGGFAMITGEPYPVKALWALNDLLVALEGTRETKEALMNLEFMVGSDFFLTPTMELCDIILPPSTYLERDEIEDLNYTNLIAARQR